MSTSMKSRPRSSSNGSSSDGGSDDNGNPQEKHEVFISFRGSDTRKSFTSHLYASLTRHCIKTYIDDSSLERGNEISSALLKAIEDSKLSIIVFSQNYADSRWCLDELTKIVECRKSKLGQMIVPIFYDVDPSAVRKQLGSYAKAFDKHMESSDKEKVQKWRDALTQVASHSGWDCSNYSTEYEIVEKIAKDVLEKLNRVDVGDLDYKIGRLEELARIQKEYSEQIHSYENKKNYEATIKRIIQLQMDKKFRMLRLPPELLSHLEISPKTNHYF